MKIRYSIKAAAKGVGEIFIYDDIGDSWDGTTAKGFAKELKGLGAVKELRVYINSAGGSVFDGVAIFNQLTRHKARKVVQVDGLAASIASVIAMAGDEIAIAANGMMMIHDPWAFALGTAAEMRKMADSLDKVGETILGTYARRTGGDEAEIKAMMADETWLTAEEALELGFADTIGAEVAMAAYAGKDLTKFRHAPEALLEAAKQEPADDAPAGPPEGGAGGIDPHLAATRRLLGTRDTTNWRRANPANGAA